MNYTDIIIIGLVVLLIALCVYSLIADKKKGGCAGCSGGCSSCSMGCTCALGAMKKE